MGLFSWFFGSSAKDSSEFESRCKSTGTVVALQRAIDTLPIVDDEELPIPLHQALVHQLAKEYLDCFVNLVKKEKRRDEIESRFDKYPLLGFEVTDEALVLYKNNPRSWPMEDLCMMALAMRYKKHDQEVTRLRSGKIRETTTPTLRGGGNRVQPIG